MVGYIDIHIHVRMYIYTYIYPYEWVLILAHMTIFGQSWMDKSRILCMEATRSKRSLEFLGS